MSTEDEGHWDGTDPDAVLAAQEQRPQDSLYRYPRIGPGKNRISQLVHGLDTHLRDQSPTPLTQHDREAERR